MKCDYICSVFFIVLDFKVNKRLEQGVAPIFILNQQGRSTLCFNGSHRLLFPFLGMVYDVPETKELLRNGSFFFLHSFCIQRAFN